MPCMRIDWMTLGTWLSPPLTTCVVYVLGRLSGIFRPLDKQRLHALEGYSRELEAHNTHLTMLLARFAGLPAGLDPDGLAKAAADSLLLSVIKDVPKTRPQRPDPQKG